jgi:hypothetical protein
MPVSSEYAERPFEIYLTQKRTQNERLTLNFVNTLVSAAGAVSIFCALLGDHKLICYQVIGTSLTDKGGIELTIR